ncbi:MAG: type II toxin-antitoxin system HicA family toxin [Candidatus Zambryskibacteria bacterium]|nr:type II toxin-antitoxin system HicA family toxin [Candidatus Zambryskibacteria bacterium]
MPRLSPISWIKFVKKMRIFGFDGPFQEGRHPYMVKGNVTITIPNPHSVDISPDLLSRILRQAEISRLLWTEKE